MNCSHCVSSSSNYVAAGIQSFFFFLRSQHWTADIALPRISSGYDKNIHICLRTLQNCRSLPRQPSSSKPWKEHTCLKRFSSLWTSPISSSEEVKMSDSSLWWWWLLWLPSLNFNPQQPTVVNWVELYVLLMMAKFHTWKTGIVDCMKDPVSTFSVSPSFFLFTTYSFCFLLSVLSYIMYSLALLFFWKKSFCNQFGWKVTCHSVNDSISFSPDW